MKQLFHIEQRATGDGQEILSLRIGEKHACFAVTDRSGSELFDLGYARNVLWDEKELDTFYETFPSLQHNFQEVMVAYDMSPNLLVPSSTSNPENVSVLRLIGADNGRNSMISEDIPGWQIKNVYAVPKPVSDWVHKKYPAAKHRQDYSLSIRNLDIAGEEGSICVDFRSDDFTVMAARKGKLLLANNFAYSTPADVLYYLLKLCQVFSLSQQEVRLKISGLIDKQSSLYKELYQYFIHIEFREPSWRARSEYPEHFFTSLNDLARCAL